MGLLSVFKQQTPPVSHPELDQIKTECLNLLKKSSFAAAGAAVIPIPFFDTVVDAGILSQILPEISAKFGLGEGRTQVYDSATKKVNWQGVATLGVDVAGIVTTRGIARRAVQGLGGKIIARQVTKFIPLGGQLVAATISYMAMKKIVHAHIEDCYKQAAKLKTQPNRS